MLPLSPSAFEPGVDVDGDLVGGGDDGGEQPDPGDDLADQVERVVDLADVLEEPPGGDLPVLRGSLVELLALLGQVQALRGADDRAGPVEREDRVTLVVRRRVEEPRHERMLGHMPVIRG